MAQYDHLHLYIKRLLICRLILKRQSSISAYITSTEREAICEISSEGSSLGLNIPQNWQQICADRDRVA
jgi:hypothetical protein